MFEGVDNITPGLQGLFDSITIVLSTPFLAAGAVAVLCNLILPDNELLKEEEEDVDLEAHPVKHKPDGESISSGDEKAKKEA